jgi:hypothetical protein
MSKREWKDLVGELSSSPTKGGIARVHRKSIAKRDVPAPLPTREPLLDDLPEWSESEDNASEGKVEEELLEPTDEQVLTLKMCREGGTVAINFLLSKVISPVAMITTEKSPK